MQFTLKQLKYIDAVGRYGSLATAANELAISQSSIVAAVTAAEAALGYDLFIRTRSKGMKLTSAGQEVHNIIRKLLLKQRMLENELRPDYGAVSGVLRLGCQLPAAPHFLAMVITSFARRYKEVTINSFEGEAAAASKLLEDRSIDLMLSIRPHAPDFAEFQPLFAVRPFAVLSAKDALASKTVVSLEELASKPMIAYNNHDQIAFVRQLFASCGRAPLVSNFMTSQSIARTLVQLSSGYLIKLIWKHDLGQVEEGICLRPISNEIQPVDFGIATLPDARLTGATRMFVSHCRYLAAKGSFECLTLWPGAETQ